MSAFFVSKESSLTPVDPPAIRRSNLRTAGKFLEVRMFNVGAGEAILVTFPRDGERVAWMVDFGTSKNKALADELTEYLKKHGPRLAALVSSHPHEDHFGAVPFLLENARQNPGLFAQQVDYYHNGATTAEITRPWFQKLQTALNETTIAIRSRPVDNGHRHEDVGATHLYIFSGKYSKKDYQSVFIHATFGEACLLFTGDSYCDYERQLITDFGTSHFRADLLKITHHGSSDGTSMRLITNVQPSIAISSTAPDPGHTLESDVKAHLPGGCRVLQTLTDGLEYDGGVLYRITKKKPGEFANALQLKKNVPEAKPPKKPKPNASSPKHLGYEPIRNEFKLTLAIYAAVDGPP